MIHEPTVPQFQSFYQQQLQKWLSHSQSHPQLPPRQYFLSVFLPSTRTLFQAPVILDKCAADALKCMLGSTHRPLYPRAPHSQGLLHIAQQLAFNRFISQADWLQIQYLASDGNSIECKLEKVLKMVRQCEVRYGDVPGLRKVWEAVFVEGFEQVWAALLDGRMWESSPKLVEALYRAYKAAVDEMGDGQLRARIRAVCEMEQLTKADILTTIVRRSLPSRDLTMLYRHIVGAVESRYPDITPKVEVYGSYRNGFALVDSDVDFTVFTKTANNQHADTSQIMLSLQQHFRKIEGVQSLQLISGARVPVLKLELSLTTIKKVDIVLNNSYGVRNSQFLYYYSREESVKHFVVMVKIWANKFKLIDKFKFSSYSIVMMALFYLIKTGKAPAGHIRLSSKDASSLQAKDAKQQRFSLYVDASKLQQIGVQAEFRGFLNYYSLSGPFFSKPETICLMDGASMKKYSSYRPNCSSEHGKIAMNYLLVNIHDIWENRNLCRVKRADGWEFYEAIDKTLLALREKSNKQLMQFFMGRA